MDSDKELFLTQNCFSQEVEESNFSMGCIIGEKGNDLESDPRTLSMKIWRKYYPRKKSRKDRQIHGKLQQVVEWILLGSLSNHDDDGNKPPPTNLHIWQWKTVFLHALHVHFSSFDILKTFSFFLQREMTCFAVVWTTWIWQMFNYVPSAGSNLIPG